MGVVIPQIITEDRASVAQFIDGSLKFNDTKGTNLTRTFSASNRRTWTWSGWVRRNGTGGTGDVLFSGYNGTANQDTYITFVNSSTSSGTTDAIALFSPPAGNDVAVVSTGVFRDTGWYHIVVSCDTTQSTAADRSRIYINGEEVTYSTTTYPSEDEELAINKNSDHSIGDRPPGNSALFDGAMSQVYFIDGLAIGPEYFGFTDPLTNTWRPKKFKAEGTTYNDGTVWSSGSTVTGGSISNAADGFDGDLSSSGAHCTLTATDSNTTANVTFAVNFKNVTKVEVFVHSASSSGDTRGTCETPNGVTFTSSTLTSASQSFHTIYEGEPIRLKNIGWGINQNGQTGTSSDAFRAFRINGEILIDSTTRNLAFGTNGFYLPMDGNSPIGEDRSGKGNDFTPTNFGGSVALDNSQVSGARPILNTTPGGTQAVVGVFGSKENATYTATGSSGSGSGYAFDGVSGNNPSFSFIRGATYTFDYSAASGHPIRFSSTDPDSSTTAYTTGTNTATSNVIKFTVPHDAPDNLWYYCTNHSNMNGAITVTTDNTKADQYASNCTLALPLVGNDDDVCASIACTANNKTPTNSSVVAATTQSNFYSGSHYWSANSDTLQYAQQGNELVFGTGDFTIECWVYDDNGHDGTSNRCYIFDNRIGGSVTGDPPTMVAFVDTHSEWNLYIVTPDASIAVEVGTAAIIDRWNHFAVTREGSTVRMFVNGIQLGSSTSSINFTNNGIGVGRATDASYGWAGYIQDFRVYTGVAKYTSNFVPAATSPDFLPDTPSGVSGGSKLTKITDGAVAFDGSGDYLSLASSSDFTFGETGDFTIEFYLYLNDTTDCGLISNMTDWNTSSGYNNLFAVAVQSNVVRWFNSAGTVTIADSGTSTNRWCHYAFCREGSTITMYKDGISVGTQSGGSQTYSGQEILKIGSITNLGDLNGFISNTRIIKGTALYTSDFTPPSASLTNVTNTKLLCCQSNTSATAAAVTPGSITANGNASATTFNPFITDINTVRGQETGYATLNPLNNITEATFADGNLKVTTKNASSHYGTHTSTLSMSSGKHYAEVTVESTQGYPTFGVCDVQSAFTDTSWIGSLNPAISYYGNNGKKYVNGASAATYGSSFGAGNTIGIAVDLDNLTVEFFRDGVSQGLITGLTDNTEYFFGGSEFDSGSGVFLWNYGQKPFKFPPPDGFQPLNNANTRPVKVFARPDQFFGVVLYNGTGSTQSISELGFKPDVVWVKRRNGTGNHNIQDSVRGAEYFLQTDATIAQSNSGSRLSSFDDDGFTLTSDNGANNSSGTYVGWAWKAGGSKNTFNVDDVGHASASDVGMNVGGQNNNAFNDDIVWSNYITPSDTPNKTRGFNGNTGDPAFDNGSLSSGEYITFTPPTPISFTKSVAIFTGGVSGMSYKFNGGSATSIDASTRTVIATGNGTFTSFALTRNTTTVHGWTAIEIDGKILLDNGVTPAMDFPSVANIGASVGTKQGFSIIRYQGGGNNVTRVSHGLLQVPQFMIIKNIDDADDWTCYHEGIGNSKYLTLNDNAAASDGTMFNDTTPTSTVFTLGAAPGSDYHNRANRSGYDYIAYVWHDVPGLQKFGTYEGNGSTDGPFVECGFKPALIIIKQSNGTNNWFMIDTTREPTNPAGRKWLLVDTNDEEITNNNKDFDILSNGFKPRLVTGYHNDNGVPYVYMAWAETPTVNLYGGGANAR